MTQKHFIALADALRKTRPLAYQAGEGQQWYNDLKAVAEVCAENNPLFNRNHWFDYIDGKVPAKGRRPKNQ